MRTALFKITILALGTAAAWAQASPAAPSAAALPTGAPSSSQSPAGAPPQQAQPRSGTQTPRSATPSPAKPARPARVRVAGYLGVGALDLKDTHGAEVNMIDQDAPAAKAGLREHDVITTFNGTKVNSAEQLRDLIRPLPAGREVTLGVVRSGRPITIKTKLGKRSDVYVARGMNGPIHISVPEIMVPTIPAMAVDVPGFSVLQYSLRDGAVVEELTPQLAEYFGVRSGGGILVRQVLHGTPAEAAGLRAGDVIFKAGHQRVQSYADWRRALHTQGTLPIAVIRERRQQVLAMKLPQAGGPEPMPLDMSEMDAEMQEMQRHMQELGPEIEQAARQAQMEFQRHMRQLQKAQRAHAEAMQRARAQRAHTEEIEAGAPEAPAQTLPPAPAPPAGEAAQPK